MLLFFPDRSLLSRAVIRIVSAVLSGVLSLLLSREACLLRGIILRLSGIAVLLRVIRLLRDSGLSGVSALLTIYGVLIVIEI